MQKLLFFFILFLNFSLKAQNIKIFGTISNIYGEKLPYTYIYNNRYTAISDSYGYYEIKAPANQKITLYFKYLNFTDTVEFELKNESINYNHIFKNPDIAISTIYKRPDKEFDASFEKITTRNITNLPSISGNYVETLVKTNLGVVSTNELSSKYNVRGGNFDENLVYINGIEIYRPTLIRSGQQEGLSIINSDMVQNIKFSAGGFDAQYGDKISSVLDITYKTPSERNISISLGLITNKIFFETVSQKNKIGNLSSFRYRRNDYLFKTFETKGAYKPIFWDFQSYTNFVINNKISFAYLFYLSSNVYNFIPESSTTEFGTFNQPLHIDVYYEGKEKDNYFQHLSGFIFKYDISEKINFSTILNVQNSLEKETFDIIAYYDLSRIYKDFDTSSITNLQKWGYGMYLTHARNYLAVNLINLSSKLTFNFKKTNFITGFDYKINSFEGSLNEWKFVDSAGYSITKNHTYSPDKLLIYNYLNNSNKLKYYWLSFFIQNTYEFYRKQHKYYFNTSIRWLYNSYNDEILISPRFIFVVYNLTTNWSYKFSTGVYHQPPFYKEMIDIKGNLAMNLKSQKSWNFIFGVNKNFKVSERPFKFTAEAYYKHLTNLIPYEIDNLKIQYFPNQLAKGFATGLDLKIFGQFIAGADSWFTISLLKTMEDIYNDYYYKTVDFNGNVTTIPSQIADTIIIYPGYIPRPTDNLVNLSIFFQDYVPGNEKIRVGLGFYFSTPAPFGPPQTQRYLSTLRSSKPYIRADLNFSFIIKDEKNKNGNFFDYFKKVIFSVDIFNFMGIKNRSNYLWLDIVPLTDVSDKPYFDKLAVPQSLTGRLINLNLNIVL